jgi:hypothetical protein
MRCGVLSNEPRSANHVYSEQPRLNTHFANLDWVRSTEYGVVPQKYAKRAVFCLSLALNLIALASVLTCT